MKRFTNKTLEDTVQLASNELNIEVKDLMYEVIEEKKSLFKKKCTIEVYETADVIEYSENYIRNIINSVGLEVSLKTLFRDNVIKILIETDRNSLIIGRNGKTLQSLNELVKLATNKKFKRKFKILLDIHGYKEKKYSHVISEAKKIAREVLNTHMEVKLKSMTPDERKRVHSALSNYKNIKTESIGDGKERAIVIKYVDNSEE